jgi:predicted RNase H-like nuclease (RuvC/YqgF family)
MSEIGGIVDSLEVRFQKLFKKLESLQQANQELTVKLDESEKIILNQTEEIKKIKSNFDSIKITNSLLGSDEYKRDTKLKINSLIREIDYCIAQLSD